MARNIQNERVKIYLSDPEYFKILLKNRVNKQHYDVATRYLDSGRTLFEVGREHHISKERVRQIVAKVLFVVIKLSMKREKDMANMIGKALQQEEFDKIKELLFRGEIIQEISRITGRSAGAIKQVQGAETLNEYFEIGRAVWGKYKESMNTATPTPKGAPLPSHYRRLKDMRELLDTVLADFIVEEIERNQRDIVEENIKLKREVERLRKQIEELQQPDFIKVLEQKMQPKQIPETVQP